MCSVVGDIILHIFLPSLVLTDECVKIGTARGSDRIDRKATERTTRLSKGKH